MIPYREKKIQNAIVFFAQNHPKKAKKPLYQVYLYKYLAFLDFLSLRETGRPALELTYKAMKRGPVPVEIYYEKINTDKYRFVKDEWGEFIVSKGKPDMDYFSHYEIDLMERLIEIYAQQWITTNIMSDSSHDDILAWQRTWAKQKNSIIDYKLEFEEDVFFKKDEDLTYPEEVYRTYKTLMS